MAKFNNTNVRPNVTSEIKTVGIGRPTYEGAIAFERGTKSELYLLALSNLVGEDTYYETKAQRDTRFRKLIHEVTREDPEWIARLVPWLRDVAQLRSASLVMAAEYAKTVDRRKLVGPDGKPRLDLYPRYVINSAMSRADEPGEFLAYWASQYGKNFPQSVKRGVADAAVRLYNEFSSIKYDSKDASWRFGDVIEVTHARPRGLVHSDLFKYLIDKRHNRDNLVIPRGLRVINTYNSLLAIPVADRRSTLRRIDLDNTGITWENLSGWLQGEMNAEAWEKVIPNMGYMARLRNLRNFEEKGVSNDTLEDLGQYLADPDNVAKSRQFPMAFYSAYKKTNSTFFAHPLEKALQASLKNVPTLRGKGLILVDLSASMFQARSKHTERYYWEDAAIFGTALAMVNSGSDLYGYSSQGHNYSIRYDGQASRRWAKVEYGRSNLRTVAENFEKHPSAKGGTETFQTLKDLYAGHDWVVILTDEQAFPHDYDSAGNITVPIYTFNIAGYSPAQFPNGEKGRYVFGGLTDNGFKMLDILHKQRSVGWPHLSEQISEKKVVREPSLAR